MGSRVPGLRALLGPVAASLVLGLVGAAWHIPMFFVSGTRQTYPFLGFVLRVVAISVVMTWVFDRTGGSVVIAALFHAAMNTAWAALNVLWGDAALFWLCVGFTVALAVVVGIAQQKRPVSAPLSAAEIAGDTTPGRASDTVPAARS